VVKLYAGRFYSKIMEASGTGILTASAGKGRTAANSVGIFMERGAVLCIFGRESPHVGAVALAVPRPSLKDPRRLSATSSVLTVVGHKEDEIVKPLSEEAAKKLNLTTVVVAGLHVEKASDRDIEALKENAKLSAEKLVKTFMRRWK